MRAELAEYAHRLSRLQSAKRDRAKTQGELAHAEDEVPPVVRRLCGIAAS